jgi:MarR family transcriptional regulator, organic hydroperoxide resistance regulator
MTPDKETTRFAACLLFSANALARAITHIGDEAFARLGLTYSHAYLLWEIVESPGITPTVLSERMFLSPSTITRLIEKLEQKNLVIRQSEGKNTLVSPTELGRILHPQIVEAAQQNTLRYMEIIGGGPDELITLTKEVFGAATAFVKG